VVYFQPVQDIQISTRASRAQYQYTLTGTDAQAVSAWSVGLAERLRAEPALREVASEAQEGGLRTFINVDREKAGRLGISMQVVNDTLNDAFAQRQISTIYAQANQYRVVLEAMPQYQQDPSSLSKLFVPSTNGSQVPVSAFTSMQRTIAPLAISHQAQFPAVTISFNLAPVGALLALMLTRQDLSVVALIGIVLLMGIVKKNAIMMIDFALEAERKDGLSPRDSIVKAAMLRFRPIMMTTLAALFGALPLALEQGTGSELRFPLGVTIIGGLLLRQLLTLYTTPVIYLMMERLRARIAGMRPPAPQPAE